MSDTKLIKIKLKKEVETEIEVSLPAYIEHGYYFYKITSENSFISVGKQDYKTEIEINDDTNLIPHLLERSEEGKITAAEFWDRYNATLSILSAQAPPATPENFFPDSISERLKNITKAHAKNFYDIDMESDFEYTPGKAEATMNRGCHD